MRKHTVLDLVLFTVQDNTAIAKEWDVAVPDRSDIGKWVWVPVLGIVGFVFKGHSNIRNMGPNYYSCLPGKDNHWQGAMKRALRLELKRIEDLDLPTESI